MFHSSSLSHVRSRRARGAAVRAGAVFIALLPALVGSQSEPPACAAGLPAVGWLSDREAGVQTQTQLPETCLKSLVRQCEVEAEAGFLDGGSAATCSLRYEALLRQSFRGDFHALLRWWQNTPGLSSQ
jgi:hypothetical protein